jgi:hypothetical protein
MDTIQNLFSTLYSSKENIIEGDCFENNATKLEGSDKYNPLMIIEVYKKYVVLFVISLLLACVGMYLIYGDETEEIIKNMMDQIQMWFGSLLLGGYLSAAGELKTNKTLTTDDIPVDINEMISL